MANDRFHPHMAWYSPSRRRQKDDGQGWVYALTRMGGLECNLIKVGQTRYPPEQRARHVLSRALWITHKVNAPALLALHEANHPELWASRATSRWTAERESLRLLRQYSKGQEVFLTDLPVVLSAIAEATGNVPKKVPFKIYGVPRPSAHDPW